MRCQGEPDSSFEFLEHPADIGFRAWGGNLRDLFANCACALLALILDVTRIETVEQHPISAEGTDYESLLVNFLNEVLYYVDGKRLAFADFVVEELDVVHITCIASGEPRNRKRHRGKLVVKAVTYHQLRVAMEGDRWTAEVYVDI